MKRRLVAFVLVFYIHSVTGLVCWLCARGRGSSFVDCNIKKIVQNCSEDRFQEVGKGPLDRCAYFSYFSFKKGKRLYAKSCTFASFCTDSGEEFCKRIPGGAKQCQIECCNTSQCNDRDRFLKEKTWQSTTSLPTTSLPTTSLPTTSLPTTSLPTTTPEQTTIKSSASACSLISGVLIAACAVSRRLVALVEDGGM